MLTPLPGSEDHKKLHEGGVWMDPDLNKDDLETTTTEHPRMSREVWQKTYEDMWAWYYTQEHVERLMRRNVAYGINPVTIWRGVLQVYGAIHSRMSIPSSAAISAARINPAATGTADRTGIGLLSSPYLADGRQARARRSP